MVEQNTDQPFDEVAYIEKTLKNALIALTSIREEVFAGEKVSGQSQALGHEAIGQLAWSLEYIKKLKQEAPQHNLKPTTDDPELLKKLGYSGKKVTLVEPTKAAQVAK